MDPRFPGITFARASGDWCRICKGPDWGQLNQQHQRHTTVDANCHFILCSSFVIKGAMRPLPLLSSQWTAFFITLSALCCLFTPVGKDWRPPFDVLDSNVK